MRKSTLFTGIAILLSLFVMFGCKDDSEGPSGPQAPGLPSANTMTPDFSLFEETAIEMSYIGADVLPTPNGNFANAAVRVFYLKTVVFAASVVPVAAFSLAVHSVPQLQQDGSWLWTYIYMNGTIQNDILLYGKQMEDFVYWRMVVSNNDPMLPLDHFLWFDGQVQNNRMSGYWQFYEPTTLGPQALAAGEAAETPGTPVIRVDWQVTGWNSRVLEILVNKDGSPAEGSTLTFSQSPTERSVVFYNALDQKTGAIIWYPDGSGSIEWPDYNNGVKACWDALKQNVDCR